MGSESLETISRVLFVLLIAILLIIMYNRLLKALGKGKYKKSYPTLHNHENLEEEKTMLINFTINKTTPTKIEVMDSKENLISVLLEEDLEPKNYTIKLDYSEMKSGQYSYKLITENQSVYKFFWV